VRSPLASLTTTLLWRSWPIQVPGQMPSRGEPTIDVNPTSTDAPGRQIIQDLLDWLGQYSLWACLAAIIAGGGLFAWGRRAGAHGMAMTGTALAGGGVVGTILVGLAPEIVTTFYRHA
jgi:hypothetical protein